MDGIWFPFKVSPQYTIKLEINTSIFLKQPPEEYPVSYTHIALLKHPSVLECAVTAVPDPVRGQVVKATVVLARGFEACDELKKELQTHVKNVTAPYKYPRVVEFVEELPKTVSGKIRRIQIRTEDAKQ